MPLNDIVAKAKQSLLGKTAPYLLSLGLALTPTLACEKPQDDDDSTVSDDDDTTSTYEIGVEQAFTDSEGKAYFINKYTDGELTAHVRDINTNENLEGARIVHIYSSDNIWVACASMEGFIGNCMASTHYSLHELFLASEDDAERTIWESIHEENPDAVDAWENFSEWVQGGEIPGYDHVGCYTRQELIDAREDTMQLLDWLTGGTQFFRLVSAGYDAVVQLDEWGVIDDLPHDYYDVYEPRMFVGVPTLILGREEPCEAEDVCDGSELFCDDFNGKELDETLWNSIGNVSLDSGYAVLEESGIISSKDINLPSTNYDFAYTSVVIPEQADNYDLTVDLSPGEDLPPIAIIGIDGKIAKCGNTENNYEYGDVELSLGENEILISKSGELISLILNGEEIFTDSECLAGLTYNTMDINIGLIGGSMYVDNSKIE